jgi:hypothetical protein
MATGVIKNINHVNIGTVQDISGYNTANNMFTCPHDCFIKLLADGQQLNSTTARLQGGDTIAAAKVFLTNNTAIQTIYVKAVMKFYFTFTETAYSKVYYYPAT